MMNIGNLVKRINRVTIEKPSGWTCSRLATCSKVDAGRVYSVCSACVSANVFAPKFSRLYYLKTLKVSYADMKHHPSKVWSHPNDSFGLEPYMSRCRKTDGTG